MPIPKTIYQIALGEKYISKLPLNLIKENILKLNGDYEYKLITDDNCDLILSEFPRHKSIFFKLTIPQHKSDMIRYMLMYKYGGIYIDIDLQPLISFDSIIECSQNAKTIMCIGNSEYQICNGILISQPNNELFMECLNSMLEYDLENYAFNVTKLYEHLILKTTVILYENSNCYYFMKEIGINEKYTMYVKENEPAILSNGNNYPPIPSQLFLTYNNDVLTDGAGAQLQRIINLFTLCCKHKIQYIHTPIGELTYQGLQNLEKNISDNNILSKINALFNLPSCLPTESYNVYEADILTPELFEMLLNKSKYEPAVVKVTLLDDRLITFDYKIAYSWISNTTSIPLHIAVHVRRGELYLVDSDRMLPNSYYTDCMRTLKSILDEAQMPFEFHIYTEQVTKPTRITPEHLGIYGRIENDVIIDPMNDRLEDFNEFNPIWHINECPIETLMNLINSDILVASRSSFSYISGLLKQKGVCIFHPFWHPLDPEWISATCGEDIMMHKTAIIKSLQNRRI